MTRSALFEHRAANELREAGAGGYLPFATARDRVLRDRAARHGLHTLAEAETLELLLGRSARGEAAAMSQSLLARFGCLARVLAASIPELRAVIGDAPAVELKLMHDLARRMLEFPILKRCMLSSFGAVSAYLKLTLAGCGREQFRVFYLDRANQLIADELMGEGTIDHAPVYPREVMRRAIELNAAACCLVHNHPTGSATPSAADIEMTRRVVEAGRALSIPVHDHFLVAGEDVISFRTQGLI